MKCNLCPLCKYANPINDSGNISAKLLLVGESPGRIENIQGEPFVGRTGELLNKILLKVEIKRPEDIYLTNILLCKPPHNNINHPDVKKALKICPAAHLVSTIKKVQPEVILIMGNPAHKFFFGSEGITKKRGSLKFWNGIKVVSTLHPAYLLRGNMQFLDNVVKDFKLAKFLLNNSADKIKWQIVDSESQFTESIKMLKKKKAIGVDVEATGLDVYKGDVVIGIGISYSRYDTIYFPIKRREVLGEGFEFLWDKVYIKELKELLEDVSIKKTFHNTGYDLEMLKVDLGFDIKESVTDSLLLAHLIDENNEKKLGYLSNRYPDMVGFKQESNNLFKKIKNKDASKLPIPVVAKRCCYDAIATYRLTSDFIKEIRKDERLYDYYKRFQIPLLPVLRKIRERGFKIDLEHISKIKKVYEGRMKKTSQEIWEIAGYKFNINSSNEIGHLFDKLGFPVIDRTKKEEKPKTDVHALNEIKRITKHPIIDLLLGYKGLQKDYSSYIISLPQKAVNGIIHSNINITTAVTGRSASRNPSQQTITKKPDIKNIICARDGYLLLEKDLKQVEPRVLACISKDKSLIEACVSSDLYKSIAFLLWGISYEDVTENERRLAKVATLSTFYGIGFYNLSIRANITKTKAVEVQENIAKTFPDAYVMMKDVIKFAKEHKYFQSIFGRVRHLQSIDSPNEERAAEAERQAANFSVQSPAWDHASVGLRRIDEALLDFDGGIVLTEHDKHIVEIREDQLEEFDPIMTECMIAPVPPIDITMALDTKVGKNWGSLENLMQYI